MAHMVESMFSVRDLPWHGLGKVIQEAPSSEEAIKFAGLDWDVSKEEIFVGNELRKSEKYLANVRSDNGKLLGIVSERYQIIQNREAFAFTDNLLGNGISYETAGSLKGGEKIWLLARAPRHRILDDAIDPYLCFYNTHNGKESVKIMLTPVRVVCNNTLNLALNDAKRCWSAKHVGNIEDKVEIAKLTLNLTSAYMGELTREAKRLANTNLTDKNVTDFIRELFPMPLYYIPKHQVNKILNIREEIFYRYINAPDLKEFRNTAWGFIGAVSDFTTHSTPRRKTKRYRENVFEKVVSGHHILDKAYKLVA